MLMEILFVYVIPALFTVALMIIIIAWVLMPPTAKLLLLKKLGLAKGAKGYVMTAYDDRLIQTESMDVFPEGAMEKKKKHWSLTFYLAKPIDDTANTIENERNEERDRDILPPYFLDGVLPVFFGHVSKAVATNPKTLTALRLANRVDSQSPKRFKAEAMLPQPVTLPDGGETVTTMPVNVLLPFDPVDIKKNFPAYWQQSNIDATKKRHQNIGMEKAKGEKKDMIKLLIIFGAVVCVGMVITAIATGLLG